MPGYPKELFLAPPDLYICSICKDILKSPKQCMQGHAYCTDCIRTHLAIKRACPVCICPLTEASMANCLLLRDLIGRMPVRCPTTQQGGEGCTWIGPLDEQEDHVNLHCHYAKVACPNSGCSLPVQRSRLTQHDSICQNKLMQCSHCQQNMKRVNLSKHDGICERKLVECPLGCGVNAARKDIEAHLASACPLQQAVCSHEGCGELTERRILSAHDAECRHKPAPCPLCDAMVKRMDEEDHAAQGCPVRPTDCPRGCGLAVPFHNLTEHLGFCPLEEVECPHAVTTGCSAACPGRLCRRDLEAHLADPATLITVVGHLKQQASEYQTIIVQLNQQTESARKGYEKTIAELIKRVDSNKQRADATKGRNLALLKKLHNIRWIAPPCSASETIIAEQLSQEKKVEGEVWTTHHLAHEFPTSCFSDMSKPFRFESTKINVFGGKQAYVVIEKNEIGDSVGCFLHLPGFVGVAEYTITAFRFGRGPPKQRSLEHVWNSDYGQGCLGLRTKLVSDDDRGWGWPCFFDETDITCGDWFKNENNLPILVTLHLKH